MNKRYITVSLPEKLITEIDNIVENGNLAYSSRPDVIKEALRFWLFFYKYYKGIPK